MIDFINESASSVKSSPRVLPDWNGVTRLDCSGGTNSLLHRVPLRRLVHRVLFCIRDFDIQKSESRNRGQSHYHEDFLTPGIMPSFAYSRKQMRHSPKSRIKPRLRPHLKQRRTILVLNLGFLRARAFVDVFAIKGVETAKNYGG